MNKQSSWKPSVALLVAAFALVSIAGCAGSDDDGLYDFGSGGLGSDGGYSYFDLGGSSGGSCTGCTGCCQNGSCQAGTSATACGFGGLACQSCQSNEKCLSGTCVQDTSSSCNSSNCKTGCCDSNGKCQETTSDSACGTAGNSCKACSTGESCVAGVCTKSSSAKYDVTLVSAKVKNGDCKDAWLIPDSCDTFVEVQLGSYKAKSPVKKDTETPKWDYKLFTVSAKDLTDNSLKLKVIDDDTIIDDTLGTCSLSVTSSDISSGSLVKDCQKAKSVTFKFTAASSSNP